MVKAVTHTLVFACLSAAALLGGCSTNPDELRLMEPRLATDKPIARALQELLDEESSLRVKLIAREEGDIQPAIEALLDDRADIALLSNNEPYAPGITAVLPMYATVLHILIDQAVTPAEVIAKRDIDELPLLFADRTVFAGPPGSPSRLMLTHFAVEHGVAADDIRFVDEPASGDRCANIYVLFVPIKRELKNTLKQYCKNASYAMYSMGDPDTVGHGSIVDGMTLLDPSLRTFIIPARLYGAEITPEAVVTIAVDKMLVARRDVPDMVIYDLISEIMRLQPALAAIEPTLFHDLNEDFRAADSTFILHPGAQKYVERNEPTVYERYSGVAEVAVTVFFALLSGTVAAVRIYNIRRKNRIDTFYAGAIALRKSVGPASTEQERRAAIGKIRALEARAFELLVDEKLAADESFRIFITLANDIVGELKDPSAPSWSDNDA